MGSHNPPSLDECKAAIESFRLLGSKTECARQFNIPRSTFVSWLDIAQRTYSLSVPTTGGPGAKGRRELEITDGVIFVGGDAHYWPGDVSTAHRAFVRFIGREKNLIAVIMNGDAYDFPNLSRFDADWFKTPAVRDELEVVEDRLGEIVKASGKAKRYFSRGNHDIRFDRYLAKNAPEIRGISGMCIEDRNPLWEPCWSLFINNNPGGLVIKHRIKGGIHAAHNNTVTSGRSTCTNHLHSLKCTPWTDYNGTRWGVDAGCLCDPWGPQFSYLEDNPRNWRSGFAVFTFRNKVLMPPELVTVLEPGLVHFRGQTIEV
jgi:hypothetical protein